MSIEFLFLYISDLKDQLAALTKSKPPLVVSLKITLKNIRKITLSVVCK